MIELKAFFQNEQENLRLLNLRGFDFTSLVAQIKTFYSLRKQLLIKIETLQAGLNKHNHLPMANDLSVQTTLKNDKKALGILKKTLKIAETDLNSLLSNLPNIPQVTVAFGKTAKDNVVVQVSDHQRLKSSLSHWEIAIKLNWLATQEAVKISQSRSVIYQNQGAKLLRILKNFMLDSHLKNNYRELVVPQLVKENTLWGTGQFPKMKKDCYQIANQDLYLIPTAEVPLINFYHNKILKLSELPIKLCAYSLCFRRESGAAGKETRGIVRLHQFHKVELVQLTTPENSNQALEELLQDSVALLKMLEIPYRIVELCTGDLGFSSSKTYDLEVWMPFQEKYLEIASISNTTNFQAVYLKIRFQNQHQKKSFVHTLNGSALAIDRLIACLLEHCYDAEKNIFLWPSVLKKYLVA